jgi:hypothetical protein
MLMNFRVFLKLQKITKSYMIINNVDFLLEESLIF